MITRQRIVTLVLIVTVGLLGSFVLAAGAGAGPALQATPTPDPAAPAAPAATCDELQVIAIADQSGSMSGFYDPNGQFIQNDPNGMRFDGPEYLANTLIGLRPGIGDVSFKMAVLDFGDDPQLRMGWTDLNPTTVDEANALTAQLAPLFDPTGSLGSTVPADAVEQAGTLFAQQDSLRPQTDGCPRRLLLLFTDGLPFDDVAGFNWETHLADLAAYTGQFMPYPDYQLFVIGLDENDAFFDDSFNAWANVTGSADRVLLARSPAEMGALLARILNEALANTGDTTVTRGCADNGQIIVPPYQQQLRISLFKVTPNLRLEVVDPTGRTLNNGLPDITVIDQPTIETLVATNPQPGVWQVLTQLPAGTEDQCLVNFVAIVAREEVTAPTPGMHVTRFTKAPVAFQLVDADGNALPNYGDDRYGLQMSIELRYAGGQQQGITWSANPGQEYSGDTVVYYDGTADVLVRATALDDNLVSHNIFGQTDSPVTIASFQVDPVSFVARDLPAGGQRIGQHEEIPLGFAVVDSADQPVALDVPVEVQVAHTIDGEPQAAPGLTEAGGVHSGVLTLAEPGTHALVYTATVAIPAQSALPGEIVTLGSGQVSFEVFPVHLLGVEFVEKGGVATDPLLRPTGLPLRVRLVDEQGNTIAPAATGAADPTQLFDVTIEGGANTLSGRNILRHTGEPGVFVLEPNDLGRGEYIVTVRPAATLGEAYRWAAPEWTEVATGALHPGFWGIVAGALAVVGVLALVAVGQRNVRRHPLRGTIQIYELRPELNPEGTELMPTKGRSQSKPLPNKNKYTFRPSGFGDIVKIELTSPDEQATQNGKAQAKIYRRKVKPQVTTLNPGTDMAISGTSFRLVKDPGASGGAAANTTAPILSGSFDN